ncbi:MAG: DNA alkylation repair protein [Rubrivivax sp.]|nr:DNA alkylation repair protein [Rubrivivax sp.]
MTGPFKNLLSPALVRRTGADLQRAWPAFDRDRFITLATSGLEALEMKARAMQICAALEATLPADFGSAADILQAALAPLVGGGAGTEPAPGASGLSGWALWPVGEYVARQGQEQPERALDLLHALTQRFTAEFAIRPFIVRHPALVLATLQRWTTDASAAVRRLVSEGSRPRLPWGLRLTAWVKDPSPTLPLLRALQDDPDEAVRRSVANHLNDIAKDHPALVAAWVQAQQTDATPQRLALLRHASRTLIKQGHAGALAAWGWNRALRGQATLVLAPQTVMLGASLTLSLTLRSTAARPQALAIDYAVHHVKASGALSPKVFKGWVIELAAGAERCLVKRHSMRVVTTRRYRPGAHVIDIRVNGRVVAQAGFELQLPAEV